MRSAPLYGYSTKGLLFGVIIFKLCRVYGTDAMADVTYSRTEYITEK